MSYQVIARKWRPQTFEEVTGQEVVTQTLRNALEHDRLHHAYVFSGSRGVGKTTTARILAKAVNCHKTDKPNLTPCSTLADDACASCIEISEGRSLDVLEIDAASHTGIGEVRETILESINFKPARDRYKVFIIDEVHQLSKPAFNALLKTLEEPPDTVIFVLATTELHKVPETILSRCQEFDFRTIASSKIFDRLRLIADSENIDVTDDALREIARSGEGSMRDAQSNFDQVISFSGEKITSDDVTRALGLASSDTLATVIRAIADKDSGAILNVVDDLMTRGHDLRNFCRDLLGTLRDLLVFKVAGASEKLMEGSVADSSILEALSSPFTEADLLRFFNSLAETETKLREAAHARHTLEIGLVKLIEMRRVKPLEAIIERLTRLEGSAPAASAEKKTLIENEPAVIGAANPSKAGASKGRGDHEETKPERPQPVIEPPAPIEPDTRQAASYAPIRSPRLARLSSEELAHTPDDKLDDAYDEALAAEGESLKPINGASAMISEWFKDIVQARPMTVAGGAAAAPARDLSHLLPDRPKDEPVELPTLGPDATTEELIAYADAHPTVRMIKRTFRARIIDAKRV